MSRRILQSLPYVALAAVLAVTGYWLIFTAFMVYDDEGYVLWSLRMYSETGGLYERVFSQYGPFFYAYYDTLRRIFGLTFDNDTGRLLTLACWLIVSLTGGALTGALTRSRLAAVAATALTFVGLLAMIREPIHPGGLITLIAMGGAALGARALVREQPVAFALATGFAGAALALTKINVGAFFLIATGSWLFVSTRPGRSTGWIVALGCVLAPWLLMRALWPATWVNHYALVFACGALALVPGLQGAARAEHGRQSWSVLAGVGLVLGLVILGVVGARGTSLTSLWHGMVVAPLSHPGVYFFPVAWQAGSGLLALASLATCAVIQQQTLSATVVGMIAIARMATAAGFLAGVFSAENEGLTRFALSYGPTLAWLMVIPLAGARTEGSARARLWLAWVFVWQTLHAYPVAGSQIAWGTFLWATLLVSGVAEALSVLAPARTGWRSAGLVTVLAAALIATGRLAVIGHEFYTMSRPLGLPGAEKLRPPGDVSRQLRVIQENLQLHAGTLFSLPGMFSLNIWSQRPTPTGANVTHWFSLLSVTEQQAIIDRLEADPRACLVVHRYLLDYLAAGGFPASGPLRDYLDRSFIRSFNVGNYEFHVRRGRMIAPLSTAELSTADQTGQRRLKLVLGSSNGRTIARVALRPLHAPAITLRSVEVGAGLPWQIQPLTTDGLDRGMVADISTPFTIDGIVRLTLLVDATAWSQTGDMCVVLLDAAGEEVSAACFIR